MFGKLLNTILLLFSSTSHTLHVDGGTSCVSLLSQRIAGQKEEEEDLEDGIRLVTTVIEKGQSFTGLHQCHKFSSPGPQVRIITEVRGLTLHL